MAVRRCTSRSGAFLSSSDCGVCGSHVSPPRRRYCSQACLLEANRRDNLRRVKAAYVPRPPRLLNCKQCLTEFALTRSGPLADFCSGECRSLYRRSHKAAESRQYRQKRRVEYMKVCDVCGVPFTTARSIQRYCTSVCLRQGQNRSMMMRRSRMASTQVSPIVSATIFERDGWMCQICAVQVEQLRRWPDPWSASLDHVVPVSKGGSHTFENVQLAHLRCNMQKYNGAPQRGRVTL